MYLVYNAHICGYQIVLKVPNSSLKAHHGTTSYHDIVSVIDAMKFVHDL